MQIELRQESPLVGARNLLSDAPANLFEQVRIAESPFLELNNIRGDSDSPEFQRIVRDVVGADLPVRPNTVAQGKRYTLWWLSPDEWLAQAVAAGPATLEGELRARFEGLFASTVDVTSGYTTVVVSGEHAADVLGMGCPLDFHPRVFGPDQCAQSHFFKATIAVRRQRDDAWNLIVRRSFADYAVRMLADACAGLCP